MLWFGLSGIAPIFTIVLIVFPYVAINIWAGAKAVDKELVHMGTVYKADRSLMLRKVLIPQLMPYIFSSLRISLSLSWKIALVAEAFGVGSGVGQQLTYWFQETRVDMMLAWGVSFMIVMVLIDLSGVSHLGAADFCLATRIGDLTPARIPSPIRLNNVRPRMMSAYRADSSFTPAACHFGGDHESKCDGIVSHYN